MREPILGTTALVFAKQKSFLKKASNVGEVAYSKTMKTLAEIPCYNEGLAIGSVVLKARRYVDEVLVVDDGSTDDTKEVAQEAGAVVVAHDKNTGKGRAVKNALRYAVEHSFGALVLLDGDGQHDPNEIPQLLVPLTNDTADLVIGFRSFGQMPACIQTDSDELRITNVGFGILSADICLLIGSEKVVGLTEHRWDLIMGWKRCMRGVLRTGRIIEWSVEF